MITESEVREALKSVIKSSGPEEWAADYNFRDGAVDSLDHANLALYLEEHFGVTITDQELPSLVTINSIVEFASAKS